MNLTDDSFAIIVDVVHEGRGIYANIRKVVGFLPATLAFSDYFRDVVVSILSADLEEMFSKEPSLDFFVELYTDAFVCAIRRAELSLYL